MNGNIWSRLAAGILCLAAVLAACGQSRAVDFDLDYEDHGFEPAFDPGGLLLRDIMAAAAADWEAIVLDGHTMEIDFWYEDLDDDTLAVATPWLFNLDNRTTWGAITFDSSRANWFFDPTPDDDSEFGVAGAGLAQTIVRDLDAPTQDDCFNHDPPQTLEVGFGGPADAWGAAAGNIDALSVLRHEIGHLMVCGTPLAAFGETRDGDYDVPSLLISDLTGGVEISGSDVSLDPNAYMHIAPEQALMFPTFGASERRDIGALDVLIASTCSHWLEIDLPRKDFLNAAWTIWDASVCWTGDRFPDADDAVAIRVPATVHLHAHDGNARTLLVSDGASLGTNGNRLTVHEEMWIEGAATEVAASGGYGVLELFGPLTCAGTLRVRTSGHLISGASVSMQPGSRFIMDTGINGAQVAGDFTMQDGELTMQVGNNRLEVGNNLAVSGTVTAEFDSLLTADNNITFGGAVATAADFTNSTVDAGNDLTFGNTAATTATVTTSIVRAGDNLTVANGTLTLTRTTTMASELIAGTLGPAAVELLGAELTVGGLSLGDAAAQRGNMIIDADGGVDPALGTTGSAELHIGYRGDSDVVQHAGSVGRLSDLQPHPDMVLGTVAGSAGAYTIEDGRLELWDLAVGVDGTGVFTQNGGVVIIHGDLTLGLTAAGQGEYFYNAGELTVEGFNPLAVPPTPPPPPPPPFGAPAGGGARPPSAGSGTLNLDGGTLLTPSAVISVQTLNIGGAPGSVGSFSLGPRTLNVNTLRVGYQGEGSLDSSSGTINVALEMHVGHSHWGGRVDQIGGTVAAPSLYVGTEVGGSGIYELDDGDIDVGTFYVGNNGIGHFIQRGDAEVTADCIRVGRNPDPTHNYYLQSGGLVNSEWLIVGDATGAFGTYTLGVIDPATRLETDYTCVGNFGTGTFNHQTGVHQVSNSLLIGWNSGSGTYVQTGGELNAPTADLGADGTGVYNHSGGTHNVTSLNLGGSHTGDYNLSATGLLESTNTYVGRQGEGTFTHSGGTHNVSGNLYVGYESAANGTYNQIGGSLNVTGNLYMGHVLGSEGHFNQIGGTAVVSGDLCVGYASESPENRYHQTGGTLDVAGELQLGTSAGSSGTYILAHGELHTATTVVGVEGTGTFAQQGGLHDVPRLRLGQGGHGTYHLHDGALESVNQFVGDTSSGEVIQIGGNNTLLGKLYVGFGESTTGVYNQSAGSVTVVNDRLYLGFGESTTGVYNQSAGSVTVVNDRLYLGYGTDSSGTYTLSGGTGYANTTLTVNGTLYVGHDGDGELVLDGWYTRINGAGQIHVTSGRGVLSGEGRIEVPVVNQNEIRCPRGSLNFYGAVTGTGSITTSRTPPYSPGSAKFYANATLDGPLNNYARCDVERDGDVTVNAGITGGGDLYLDGILRANSTVDLDYLGINGGTMHVAANVNANEVHIEPGTVIHTDGRFTPDSVTIQYGHYGLSGTGHLDAPLVQLFGTFDHAGGTDDAARLRVGGYNEFDTAYGGPGTYTISGGRLNAGTMYIGDDGAGEWVPPHAGTLAITDAAAEVYVSVEVIIADAGIIEAVPGSEIHMTGSAFENYSTTAANLAELRNVELIFEGGPGDLDPFEVAGEDRAALPAGLSSNLALGTLTIGGTDTGQIQLVDLFDNQPSWTGSEALYVDHLNIGAGSSINLNGLNLYYLDATVDPGATITGGSLTPIYMPSTSAAVEGVPAGYEVSVTLEPGGSGGMGTAGMTGGGDARALSCTAELSESEVDAAIEALLDAGAAEPYITLKIFYDEIELTMLEIEEHTLRPYWWEETAGEWVLGGTTIEGLPGEGVFAGIDLDPLGFGRGYCGLNTDENYIWANVNHASDYGAGGVIPEPSTLVMLAVGGLLGLGLYGWRKRRCR